MLSTRIRTVIAGAVGIAALSVPAVASAMVPVYRPATVTPVQVVRPTIAIPMKEAGSAGVPGYDDATCQGLLEDSEVLANAYFEDTKAGNKQGAEKDEQLFKHAYNTMTSNCLVVD